MSPTPKLPLHAPTLLGHYRPHTGWNEDMLLGLALEYIENQNDDAAFLEHLAQHAAEDIEAGSPEERLARLDELLSERLANLPEGSEVIVDWSDNGDADWREAVHLTVILADGRDGYGLADMACGTVEQTAAFLLEQAREGLPELAAAAPAPTPAAAAVGRPPEGGPA